jgi:hypothetical protein
VAHRDLGAGAMYPSAIRSPETEPAGAVVASQVAPEVASVVPRDVPHAVERVLWGRAAGRCEFAGCNRPLWRTIATNESRNVAEQAHIRAFSRGGPRANSTLDPARINDASNLMLVCHDHHVSMDRGDGPSRYTVDMLEAMKRAHERRIEIVTSVSPAMGSHVVTYGTYVGDHQALPTFADAREALFPHRFPEKEESLELGTPKAAWRDRDAKFWATELDQLEYQFKQQIRIPVERGDIRHVSVFALAPQPLLIRLGALLGDICKIDVYQRLREPQGWSWASDAELQPFIVTRPTTPAGVPVLVLAISGSVTPDRVHAVASDAAVWTVTVPQPHNDVVRSPEMLRAFRQCMRPLLNEIKAAHGHRTPLQILPVMPVSLAVELGRVRMPKAEPQWDVFDEHQARGGFVYALTIHPE